MQVWKKYGLQEVWTVLKLEELNNQSEPKADKKSQEESSEHVNGKGEKT